MNIAAYMAALEVDDLDHYAKHAIQVVAGRANQHTAVAWVSIGRVAADMGVAYHTAQRALNRAVQAGYMNVDKSAGKRPCWTLQMPNTSAPAVPRTSAPAVPTKDVRRTSVGRAAARADIKSGGARPNGKAVDTPPVPPHPPSRPTFVEHPDGTVTVVLNGATP